MTGTDAALWTAIAAGVGAAVSGLVAVVVTRRQVRSTENMAKETRHQDRILRAYLTLTRYADDIIAQVGKDRAWLPGGQAPPALAPELTREEMSFSWLVCSPAVAHLQVRLTAVAAAYDRERAVRTNQLLNAGLEPTAIARVVRAQTAALPAFFQAGDLVIEAADALIAQMRGELGALGLLPIHALPTLDDMTSELARFMERAASPGEDPA